MQNKHQEAQLVFQLGPFEPLVPMYEGIYFLFRQNQNFQILVLMYLNRRY